MGDGPLGNRQALVHLRAADAALARLTDQLARARTPMTPEARARVDRLLAVLMGGSFDITSELADLIADIEGRLPER